nr:hypothetical protein [Tanacetum cinerariifolium]
MSTQQDIYAAGSETRPPMLNKENYVLWSSCLLGYAKSRPNGKLIYNFIMNGPYVRRMIPEPGNLVMCSTNKERSDIGIQEKKDKMFNKWERFTSTNGESIESYYHYFLKLMNDFKRNKHFPEKIAINLKFLNNLQPEWSRHVTIVHQTKDLHTSDYTQLYDFLKYNQKEVVQNAVQNPRVLNVRNQNRLVVVLGIANKNPNRNGNVIAARAEGNANGNNGYQIRCYNCRGLGHLARNYTVRPRRRDAFYLQNQLLISQKEEAGIQLQDEEFDLMAAASDLVEIEKVNENCILMANLQ